ncbi:MAG: hypothetical protein OXH00_07765 [Candidatus Poribacteria bacterium]|nr:hypothetical protein [Candidatus Poribacteria bacterium]
MFENVLTGLTYISDVVLAGFLVFLCLQTRSKGVIFITAVFIGFRFLSPIFDAALGAVLNAYMGKWEPSQDIRGVKLLRRLDIFIIVEGVKSILYVNLYLLGAFLIYKEWRQGKFNYPPT